MRNVWWEELKKLAEGSGGKRGRHDLSLEVLSRYEPQTTPGIHLGILAPTVPCNREAVRDSQRINVPSVGRSSFAVCAPTWPL